MTIALCTSTSHLGYAELPAVGLPAFVRFGERTFERTPCTLESLRVYVEVTAVQVQHFRERL